MPEVNPHFRHIVLRTCITPSVLSSHSPPLPLTILPIPDAPAAISFPSSIRSAFVQATIMGMPAVLCVNVPGPSGKRVLDRVELAGSGSVEGSVYCWMCDCTECK
jgi:hypothetical protein